MKPRAVFGLRKNTIEFIVGWHCLKDVERCALMETLPTWAVIDVTTDSQFDVIQSKSRDSDFSFENDLRENITEKENKFHDLSDFAAA